MKSLLTAIKTQLQTDLAYVRDSDVFVTEDEHLIPASVKFPAVALKDGGIVNTWQTNLSCEQELGVRITAYAQILKPEESVMGTRGVLAVEKDIVDSLINNKLGISSIYWALPTAEEASELLGDEEEMIQRKTVVFLYKRQKNI